MSLSNYSENRLLDAALGVATATAPAAVYVKLHIGDPGEDGTANPAGNTTRQAITFAAASGGTSTSSSQPSWTSVSTSETYSHVSLWDSLTVGNCIGSGALAASKAVIAGDTFQLTSVTVTLD
jgi:hypothetical protein